MPSVTPQCLDQPRFAQAQCDALFAAVLAHDDIHLDAELPDAISLDYSQQQLLECYRICRQIWQDGAGRADLIDMFQGIYWSGSLSAEAQRSFKDVRAKFKHLRFAYATCGAGHRYPKMFHRMTAVMGYLQDAFKNNQRAATIRHALLLRLFLTRVPYSIIRHEIDAFEPTSAAAFRAQVCHEIDQIRACLAKGEVTSREFHELRKIISRQVALHDNLKIVFPSSDHQKLSRYLNTINGLMGKLHDELIEKMFNKTQDYYADKFPIPEDIRGRLVALTQRYPTP